MSKSDLIGRRKALLRIGTIAVAAYAVPAIATITSAHAESDL